MCGSKDKVEETPEEIALAEIAMERWNDYKQRFIPVENQAISDVMGESETSSEFGPGMANIASQSQFSQLEPAVASGLVRRGARPGSGAFEGGMIGLGLDRTASSAQGQANALGLQRTQNLQNMQTLINMGQGQATGALSGLGDAASFANQQAILDARASAAARNAIGSAIGTGAGMYYGNMNNNRIPTASKNIYNSKDQPDIEWGLTGLDWQPPAGG